MVKNPINVIGVPLHSPIAEVYRSTKGYIPAKPMQGLLHVMNVLNNLPTTKHLIIKVRANIAKHAQ